MVQLKLLYHLITTNPTTLTKPSNDFTPIVLSSDTGSKSIPPLVGFRNKKRNIGETAALEENSNAKNTVKDLIYFLGTNNNNMTTSLHQINFVNFDLSTTTTMYHMHLLITITKKQNCDWNC